tara:strand:+ start:18114 stop:19454 length:1341 start_codon:yes stop_codon:yes gene_type:complete
MVKKEIKWLAIFVVFLALFCIFSTRLGFHDDYEYINIAKNFVGIDNIDLFSGHSLLYPFIISIFLEIWPSVTMMKFVNSLWLVLIGAVLLFWLKNRVAFLLFAFSPIVWFMSVQTTPVLPSAFFLLLTLAFFYKDRLHGNLIYSGLCLGFSCALYTPMILVGGIFTLVYFWGKEFQKFFLFIIAMGIGFLPRVIQDYYLFDMPVYSLIRYAGANFIIAVGLNPVTNTVNLLSNLEILSVVFLISPLLFMIYRVDFMKYRKHLIFIVITSAILLLRVQQIKYFLLLAPLIFLILSKYLSEKEIKWHIWISVVLIGLLTWNFFIVGEDKLIEKDLDLIVDDFPSECLVAGGYDATLLAANHWEDSPRFVWWQDYKSSLDNETVIKQYTIGIDSRIALRTDLEIVARFNRNNERNYTECPLVLKAGQTPESDNFDLDRCYDYLCVYEQK